MHDLIWNYKLKTKKKKKKAKFLVGKRRGRLREFEGIKVILPELESSFSAYKYKARSRGHSAFLRPGIQPNQTKLGKKGGDDNNGGFLSTLSTSLSPFFFFWLFISVSLYTVVYSCLHVLGFLNWKLEQVLLSFFLIIQRLIMYRKKISS